MNSQNIEIQGHRGCRGVMPENTISAFLEALEMGVEVLELDVCVSSDKKIVVSHEPYFNSEFTTLPNGKPLRKADENRYNLYKMPYSDIKTFDVGSRRNPRFPQQKRIKSYKPLLSEVILAVEAELLKKKKRVKYNIEIKSEVKEYNISQPSVAEFSDLVYEIIKDLPTDRLIIQSFDFEVLKYWKTKIKEGVYPKIPLAALVEEGNYEQMKTNLGFLPEIYSPDYQLLTLDEIKKIHTDTVKVIPWTVNSVISIKKMISWQVDGIISDYPHLITNLLKNKLNSQY